MPRTWSFDLWCQFVLPQFDLMNFANDFWRLEIEDFCGALLCEKR
jgi:hypothetical protein